MSNLNIYEIPKFKKFLENKQGYILNNISSDYSRKIVNLVFEILQVELSYEFELADQEFAKENKA
jgi:hypothetical protein